MYFEPEPGMRLKVNGASIEFTSIEGSDIVYAESGKEATVYKVLKAGEYYALKVFNEGYLDEKLIKNLLRISKLKGVEGLRVADRTVITEEAFPELTGTYPELNLSVLMPWIQGALWGNLMSNAHTLKKEKYIQISRLLTLVMSNLESRKLAHCDLSNNNFIIDPSLAAIELIDIEGMYTSDMQQPASHISYGTPGYRTAWIAENGTWDPGGDRFAAAILTAEILGWDNTEIRESKASGDSYFDESEIGTKSERYRIMKRHLGTLAPSLALLFDKAWFSTGFEDCPSILDWKKAVEALKIAPEPAAKPGKPARIAVSQTVLDFATREQSNWSLTFEISNPGGATLEGTISCEPWISATPTRFFIQSGGRLAISVSINPSLLPNAQGKSEFRTPTALIVESNAGDEVIGATVLLPRKGVAPQLPVAAPPGGKSPTVPAKIRKRGGCLTTWLIVVMIADAFLILYSLSMIGDYSVMAGLGELLLLIGIGQLISAGAILNWKKWGVYVFGLCVGLGILSTMSLGDPVTAAVQLIIQSALMYFLIKPAWPLMD